MTKKHLFSLIILASSIFFTPALADKISNHIAAVVNEEMISKADLDNRIKMATIFFNLPDTPETHKKLAAQMLETMVNELVELQAAKKYKIELSEKRITAAMETFAQQRGMNLKKLKSVLKEQNIPFALFETQVKASIAINSLVQDMHANMLRISDNEVDRKLAEVEKSQKSKFLHLITIHQLSVPLNQESSEEDIQFAFSRLETLISAISTEQQFLNIPKEHPDMKIESMSDIEYGALHPQLHELLKNLKVGKTTDPMMTPYGATVLFLAKNEKKKLIVTREEILDHVYAQKLDRATKLALKNLKRTTYIDIRV